MTTEEGYEAAKSCVASLLGTIKEHTNDWDHVKRIVKVQGYVNCVEGYKDISIVMNGASDTICKVLGEEKGKHARSGMFNSYNRFILGLTSLQSNWRPKLAIQRSC